MMDEDLALINSTSRNEKIKNFFIGLKKTLRRFYYIEIQKQLRKQ